jgi:hypothetical protein
VKTGIIGLPQVGKTSLFKILTKARLDAHAMHSRDAHVGVAKVPDERLDRLSALYHPKKTTHATVEYMDVAAIGQEALKEQAYSIAFERWTRSSTAARLKTRQSSPRRVDPHGTHATSKPIDRWRHGDHKRMERLKRPDAKTPTSCARL